MDFLLPWYSIEDSPDQAAGMAAELERELAPGHLLFGIPVRAIARREDCDDVLFALEDGTDRAAVVHLTWVASAPDRPPWPGSAVYESFDAWARASRGGDGS